MLYLQIEPGMLSNQPETLKTFNFILTPPPDPDVPGLHPHGREDVVCKEWVENIGDCPRWVGTPD